MTREQMHDMQIEKERAILVLMPGQNETWQEEVVLKGYSVRCCALFGFSVLIS